MEEEQILLNEFKKWFKKKGLFGMKDMWFSCAKYFYELGCRRTTEKHDEIEYNRQMTEEQANEYLEKEINKEIDKIWAVKRDESGRITNGVSEWKETDQLMNIPAIFHFARHFAQWGAEHLKK